MDLIDRQAAIHDLCKTRCGCEPEECCLTFPEDGAEECADVRWLLSLPSAEPEPSDVARDIATIIENEKDMRVIAEPRKGKWIPTHESTLFSHPDSITYVCSECGHKIYTVYGFPSKTSYCSNCGADMRGEHD